MIRYDIYKILGAFMKKSILLSVLSVYTLYAGTAVVPGDEKYFKTSLQNPDIEMIYTKQNRYAAEEAMALEPLIHKEYEKYFGYRLDQTLYVGIISQRNQIANGFSTQYPLNMQINYIGGAQFPDHFSTTSWLNTLLYHETAHNYQTNAKASKISRGLSKVFGNTALPLFPLPLFVLPNAVLTSYTLEGNAVLNESWHGNGGRLYSGRFQAESILQAKAGHITPQFLFNQTTHEFPFYDRHYVVGGFFQLYLAERFGLEKTNQFFFNHSKSWLWPFRTNHIYQMTFGESFEEALSGYNTWLLKKGAQFVEAEGEVVARSYAFSSLNNNCDKIFFLTSDAQHAPELVRFFKKDKALEVTRESYLQSKVVNRHDQYMTQSSNFTNPTMIVQGLFDEDGHVVEGTEGKLIQGYLKDGVPVYFDVKSSFKEPQLYVGDTFYAKVNSSVIIDKDDNLYYFVQEGKKRTLFKNKEALYTLNDYYGIVSDVDAQGRIYFVANSEAGSSLYRFNDGVVERVTQADNVVEARLVNDDEVLIAAIGQKDYYYVTQKLDPREAVPFERKLFFEDEPYFANASFENRKMQEQNLSLKDAYYEPLNLHYAGGTATAGYGEKAGQDIFTYSVSADFSDPLLSNTFGVYAGQGTDEKGLVGAHYFNNAHLLTFGADVYGVYNEGDPSAYYDYNATTNTYSNEHNLSQESRKYGFSVVAALPIIASGYNRVSLQGSYYQDYDSNARSPFVLSLESSHAEGYGQAVSYDYLNALSIYGSYDRGDLSGGFDYSLSHGLPWKMFAGLSLQGTRSDFNADDGVSTVRDQTRGVKFTPFQSQIFKDGATVVMPTLEHTRFVQQAAVAEVNALKQFDGRILFFTFPLSLTREVIYAKHRYYDIQDFGQSNAFNTHTVYNETTAGLSLEFLMLNVLSIPLSFEYIHNDNIKDSSGEKSPHNFRFLLGGAF